FPDNQTGSTRLVLTQSAYLMQTWIDALGDDDRIVATADRAALEACAPEALHGRGPWQRFATLSSVASGSELGARRHAEISAAASPQRLAPSPVSEPLAAAYAATDPAERLSTCREVTERAPESAAAWLAAASAY